MKKLLTIFFTLFIWAGFCFAQNLPDLDLNTSVPALTPQGKLKLKLNLIKLELENEKDKKSIKPVALNKPGIKNFYKVSDILYRGSQPTEEGYRQLAKLGIKTVVSLQVIPQETELIKSLGMNPVHIPINPLDMKDEHAKDFLSVIANPKNRPVYVHCLYGSDRTGTMVALYRIYIEHWTKERALAEMREDKYGFSEVFNNLKRYINNVDIPYRYTLYDNTPTIQQQRT